jgi:hypothetical protein
MIKLYDNYRPYAVVYIAIAHVNTLLLPKLLITGKTI